MDFQMEINRKIIITIQTFTEVLLTANCEKYTSKDLTKKVLYSNSYIPIVELIKSIM